MQVTVLGRYGPFPAAGGACSGYLIKASGTKLLLDCGAGVLSRLFAHAAPESLSGLILSHLHSDHTSDVFVLRYALEMARIYGRRHEPLPTWAPAEPKEQFEQLPYRDVFSLQAPVVGRPTNIGSLTVTPFAVQHSIPTFGWRISDGVRTMFYSADTEYSEEIANWVHGADLFLCEATYTQDRLTQGGKNHLSAGQAGQIARVAGVKRILLTHLSPLEDPEQLLVEARQEFPGAELAEEKNTYIL